MSTTTKSKAQLAREAGARGKKTAPLTKGQRVTNYQDQNRSPWLTARQQRQVRRMSRAEARAYRETNLRRTA